MTNVMCLVILEDVNHYQFVAQELSVPVDGSECFSR